MSTEKKGENKEAMDAISDTQAEQEAKAVADENKDKEQSEQVSGGFFGCG